MKERPILFNGPMVLAILDGRKTQTRRVVKFPKGKLPPVLKDGYLFSATGEPFRCPYGQPGDRLWVREGFRPTICGSGAIGWTEHIVYRADAARVEVPDGSSDHWERMTAVGYHWRPSIHMPRWASRILLEVESVRVERVQEISEEDADSEGVPPNWVGTLEADRNIGAWDSEEHGYLEQPKDLPGEDDYYWCNARNAFKSLWNDINAKRGYGWDINPWVWVVEFKRI